MVPEEVQVRYWEEFLIRKSGRALEQATQGGGGAPSLEVFNKRLDMVPSDTISRQH